MSRPWFVQQPAWNRCYEACERLLRGFSGTSVSQDRLVQLEGLTRCAYASGCATCCTPTDWPKSCGEANQVGV